jgi:hypothetical protein
VKTLCEDGAPCKNRWIACWHSYNVRGHHTQATATFEGEGAPLTSMEVKMDFTALAPRIRLERLRSRSDEISTPVSIPSMIP